MSDDYVSRVQMQIALRAEYLKGQRIALEKAAKHCVKMADFFQERLLKNVKNEHIEGRMLGWSNAADDIRTLMPDGQ